jgi:hypothetical protein
MKSFYSLDRFDTSFTSDVAMYLKKSNNEDSFVKSMRTPTRTQTRTKLGTPRRSMGASTPRRGMGTPKNKYK